MSLALLMTALKANYGAKVGQTISGALGRGGGGRFARVGAAIGASAPKRGKAPRGDVLKAAGVSEEEAKRLEAFAAGGIDDGEMDTLFEKGLIDVVGDKTVLSPQGKAFLRALKRGDTRGAADSLAKAGAKVAGEGKKADKPKPKAGGGGGKGGKDNSERDASRFDRSINRVEEIAADIADREMDSAAIVRAGNRLDEIEADAGKLSVSEDRKAALRAQIKAAREALAAKAPRKKRGTPERSVSTEKGDSRISVIKKEHNAARRWVLVSSNAYEDKEREIVSKAALDADAEALTAAGDYGPLRWWHVGAPVMKDLGDWRSAEAGEGIDIGVCDYSATFGRMLVESGTFKDCELGGVTLTADEIADAVEANIDNLRVSRGFAHAPGEPDADGVYHNIKGIERSLLPVGKEANAITFVATGGTQE